MTSRIADLVSAVLGLNGFADLQGALHYLLDYSAALRGLAALWMVVCTAAVSFAIVHRLLPRATAPLRWSAAFGLGAWLSLVGFHLLRGVHGLDLPRALFGCTLMLWVVWYALERASFVSMLRYEIKAMRQVFRLVCRSRYSLWTGFFVGCSALLALRGLVVPPLGWDTLVYHGPRAALWVHSGQFTHDPGPEPLVSYRYFFAGGEVLFAWAMIPFRSDLLVNLASLVHWVALGLGCWALSRALGIREPYAATSGAVALFVPTVQYQVNSGYIELILNASLVQAAALTVYGMRRCSRSAIILAGLCCGIAAGTKLTAAGPVLVIGCALALRIVTASTWQWQRRITCLLACAACVAVPILPWMYASWHDTGNPLFPFNAPSWLPAIGHGVDGTQGMTRGTTQFNWPLEKLALTYMFMPVGIPSESFGSLAMIPILAFPAGLLVISRRRPLAAVMLTAAAAMPVVAYFVILPESPRITWPVANARYLVGSLVLAICVSFAVCSLHDAVGRCYRMLALLYALTYTFHGVLRMWGGWEMHDVVAVGAVLMIASACIRSCKRARYRLAIGLTAWLLGCSALQVRRDETRGMALRESMSIHWSPRYWASAADYIDTPDVVHRVAMTGGAPRNGSNWFSYFLFGRRFDNSVHYVTPSQDGSVIQFDSSGVLMGPVDPDRWVERLEAGRFTEVMTFAPRSLEQAWMDGRPEQFQRLVGDGEWGLYRFIDRVHVARGSMPTHRSSASHD